MRKQIEPLVNCLSLALIAWMMLVPAAISADSKELDAELHRGKRIFERATCAGCHPDGTNSLNPTKPIKGDAFKSKYKTDSALEQVIRHGFPNAGMPRFPSQAISEKDMKALIAYIRSLSPKDSGKSDLKPKAGT